MPSPLRGLAARFHARTHHLTVRYWGAFVVLVLLIGFAYQTGHEVFFRLIYLLLGLAALAFLWAAHSIRAFELERKVVTPRAQVGRFAEERFLVRNTGRFPKIWIEIRDTSELPAHRVSRVLNALRARTHWSFNVRTLCRRRGRFQLGPITVSTGDPFGFFVFTREIPATRAVITVYPVTVDLPNFAPPLGYLSGGESLRRRAHHVTPNVAGTREYAPGDSFNRIHWLSSARTERLIVKEFELDPVSDVWIFLDLERDVHAGQWEDVGAAEREELPLWFKRLELRLPPATEEYCVTATASIARYYLNRQRAVGFVAYARTREIVQPDRGERQSNRLLEALAVLRAEGKTAFGHVIGAEGMLVSRGDTLVLVSPSPEMEWVKSARAMRRRGARVIAVIADVNTFGGRGETHAAVLELSESDIPTYVLRAGDDLAQALSGSS